MRGFSARGLDLRENLKSYFFMMEGSALLKRFAGLFGGQPRFDNSSELGAMCG